MRHPRGPDFTISRLKIHVFGHKLDTLCATRADPNLAFRALKSMFKVIRHFVLGSCLQGYPSPYNFNSGQPPSSLPSHREIKCIFRFIVKSNAFKKTH